MQPGAAIPPSAFELRIPVRNEDVDQLGHVNNVVYLRWVQEIAIAHWRVLASVEERAKLLWVVQRHEIDYKRPALPDDVVIARTWVGEAHRRAFERHTAFLRESDGRLLAQALTLWCPVDAATLRPTEVDAAIRARFSIPRPA